MKKQSLEIIQATKKWLDKYGDVDEHITNCSTGNHQVTLP